MDLNQEMEQALNGAAESPVETPAATTTPATQEQIEMLEIMAGGKPLKLPMNAEFPIKHNGQILKTPLEKLLNSFRQGAHFEDKAKELRTGREQFEKERGDLESFNAAKQKFGGIQDWSEKNPAEWDRLWAMFQNKDKYLAGAEGANPYVDMISQLQEKLTAMETWKGEMDKSREAQETEVAIKQVNADVDTFKKEWPEIDLEEKNLDGVSLKAVIMKSGLDKGLREFGLAALDYLRPRLLDIAQQRGRNEAVKSVQTDKQQGILARGSKPFTGQSSEVSPKMGSRERDAQAKAELAEVLSSLS